MKQKVKIKVYFYWTIVVLYLAMIFYFSSQDGTKSHEVSAGLLEYIKVFTLLIPDSLLDVLSGLVKNNEYILRKAAHFTEYFILGLIFYRALVVSKVKVKKSILVTLIFCFLYAISDEVHQIFVPGRAFAVKDILIDTSGAALGLGLLTIRKYKKKGWE